MFSCIPPARRLGGRGQGGRGHVSGSRLRSTSFTLDDEQLYYKNDVAVGGNDDAGGNDRGMNVSDGGDDHGLNDDEG